MASDLNSILRKYIANLGKNEEPAVELTRNLRNWAVQNGEAVKERIETQIDEAAVRMGFAKSSELENLNARIVELENRLKSAKIEGSKKIAPVKAPKAKSAPKLKKSTSAKRTTTPKKKGAK